MRLINKARLKSSFQNLRIRETKSTEAFSAGRDTEGSPRAEVLREEKNLITDEGYGNFGFLK